MKSLGEYMSESYMMIVIEDKEEGIFTVSFPELKGCLTCVSDKSKIMYMAEDAKREWFKACMEDGIPIPEPSIEKWLRMQEVSR